MSVELRELNRHLDALLAAQPVWTPLPGPQTVALESLADQTFYGGGAGSAKTDLLIGAALTRHKRSAIFRREGTAHSAIIDRIADIRGSRDEFNASERTWRFKDGRTLELLSCPDLGSETRHQGRPHSLLAFDELTHFEQSQFEYLLAWNRSSDPTDPCRVIATMNPPTSVSQRWVLKLIAPWIDPLHPRPAQSGEIRYFAKIDGEEIERDGPEPFEHEGLRIVPFSRTFVFATVKDNPYLKDSGYVRTLMALPSDLRAKLLYGSFTSDLDDDEFALIKESWVELSMQRWKKPAVMPPMDSIGLDPSRGGKDETCIARRHANFVDTIIRLPGREMVDGPTCAGKALGLRRDAAVIHVDVLGIGSSVYDQLVQTGVQVVPVNVSERSTATDKSGFFRFFNTRSEIYWRLREALDPTSNTGLTLPRDAKLKAELCALKWEVLTGGVIKVSGREELHAELGRSIDSASALAMALIDTPKDRDLRRLTPPRPHDPIAAMEREMGITNRFDYDPLGGNLLREVRR